MQKEINHANALAIKQAQQTLQKGDLIGLPTETVYGLAANALSDIAVAKIYALKERPHFNPLIAHFATADEARKYVCFNDWADTLANAFWPGPLTLILEKKKAAAFPCLHRQALIPLPSECQLTHLLRSFYKASIFLWSPLALILRNR